MVVIEARRRQLLLRLLLTQMCLSIVSCISDLINTILYHDRFGALIDVPAFGYGLGVWTPLMCIVLFAMPVSCVISGNYYDRCGGCWFCSLGFCCVANMLWIMIDQVTIVYETCVFIYAVARSDTLAVAVIASVSLICTVVHAVVTIIVIKLIYKEKYRQRQMAESTRCGNEDNCESGVLIYQVPMCPILTSTIVSQGQMVQIV